MTAPAAHEVLGRTVTLPVEVRQAQAMTAMFAVRAAPAQALIAPSGLRIRRLAGRAVVGLVFVRYVDNDLGPYDELGVAVLVHDLVAGPRTPGVLIHELPVDGEFTMAAGRQIWGFPKQLADFDADLAGPTGRVRVVIDGELVAALSVRRGVRMPPAASSLALAAYSHLDGVTRRTAWTMDPVGARSRPAGATLKLGPHPIGRALADLGLPRRALFSTRIDNLRMSFGEAGVVDAADASRA